jgi:Taurine catabolism dioxygenase TauD, TfdA family
MAQTPDPPTHVFFYSDVVAATGGQTPILSSTELYSRLSKELPHFIEAIETLGVKYVRTM